MKVQLSKSGTSKNLLQKNNNTNFTTVKKPSFMMCMC
ncbi:hypothetical protein J2W48_001428 [Flavobacterium piscis]|uniref:Uncharacterized protein n=1 Tax=Flavobacterium piscis TaxID=1114874 RepID=A0ABU1Y5J3_9FLAO|nr:hypothetical protein [Flavobacterium piscis]